MSITISQIPTPDRPNLERDSVAFSAVTGAGVGAVLGAGIGAVSKGLKLSEESLSRSMGTAALDIGVTVALINGLTTWAVNRQKDATKPYVERLEREVIARDLNQQQR